METVIILYMKLKKRIDLNSVRINLQGTTKDEIIRELASVICSKTPSLDYEIILKSVMDREAQMSTGMKNGVAIPHGKTDYVQDLYAAVGLSKQPVEFESLDGEPSRIFIMTISPASRTGEHLEFLAEVSRLLISEDTRKHILDCKSNEELLNIFLEKERP